MPVLPNQRHELFAHAIVKGFTPAVAYQKANFTGKSLNASSNLVLHNPDVRRRITELQTQGAEVFVAGNIANRNYRISVLNDLADRMYMELKAKQSLLNSISLLKELREYHKQASIECGQWEEKQQLTVQVGDNDYSKLSEDQIQAALDKMKEARAMLNAIPGEAETVESSPEVMIGVETAGMIGDPAHAE